MALDIFDLNQKLFYEQTFPCANKSSEYLRNEERLKKHLQPFLNKTFIQEKELYANGTSLENMQTNVLRASSLQLQQSNTQACQNIKKSQPEINNCVFIEKIKFLSDLSVRLNDKYLCKIRQRSGIKNSVKTDENSSSFQVVYVSNLLIFLDCPKEYFLKNESFVNDFNGELEINSEGFELINLYKSANGYYKNIKQFKQKP